MGAQQKIVPQVVGVLHIPCGMVLRDVQGREVVVVLLHLRAFGHAVSEPQKEINDLFGGGDQRMAMAHRRAGRRSGDVQTFPGDPFLHRHLLHDLKSIGQQALHLGFQHIGPLAHHGTFVAGQLAHGTEHRRDSSLLAKQSNPQLLQLLSIAGSGDISSCLLLQCLQLIGDLLQRDRGAHRVWAGGS